MYGEFQYLIGLKFKPKSLPCIVEKADHKHMVQMGPEQYSCFQASENRWFGMPPDSAVGAPGRLQVALFPYKN